MTSLGVNLFRDSTLRPDAASLKFRAPASRLSSPSRPVARPAAPSTSSWGRGWPSKPERLLLTEWPHVSKPTPSKPVTTPGTWPAWRPAPVPRKHGTGFRPCVKLSLPKRSRLATRAPPPGGMSGLGSRLTWCTPMPGPPKPGSSGGTGWASAKRRAVESNVGGLGMTHRPTERAGWRGSAGMPNVGRASRLVVTHRYSELGARRAVDEARGDRRNPKGNLDGTLARPETRGTGADKGLDQAAPFALPRRAAYPHHGPPRSQRRPGFLA